MAHFESRNISFNTESHSLNSNSLLPSLLPEFGISIEPEKFILITWCWLWRHHNYISEKYIVWLIEINHAKLQFQSWSSLTSPKYRRRVTNPVSQQFIFLTKWEIRKMWFWSILPFFGHFTHFKSVFSLVFLLSDAVSVGTDTF